MILELFYNASYGDVELRGKETNCSASSRHAKPALQIQATEVTERIWML